MLEKKNPWPPESSKERCLRGMTTIAIGWYLLLCVLHLFSLRPLWNDEECVFKSVEAFSPKDFFTKLLLAFQVFPRVYLFLIQQISKPFHFHLLMVRLPSFLCMVGAFFVWLKIASYEFKNRLHYLTFVLCWGASAVLIYYAAELKPYSMDVLVGALFILFLYRQEELEKNQTALKYSLILTALPALVLFSYPAYVFVFLPLYNLLLPRKKAKGQLLFLMIYTGSLLTFGLFSYYFDVRLRPVEALTDGFHDYFISFASTGEFFKTLGEGTMNLLSRWFVERPKILKQIGVFFVSLGFFRMFLGFFQNIGKDHYRVRSIHTLALVIFAELFLLGALKKYPFTVPRTSLFFCPIVLFLTVKGIDGTKNLNAFFHRLLNGAFLFYLFLVSIGISVFVFRGELTFRPVLW